MKPGATAVAMCLVIALLVSCGSDEPSGPSAQPESSPEITTEAATGLVGTWSRQTRCLEVVEQLEEAGLEKWIPDMVEGSSFIPGAHESTQLKDVCKGAIPREHSHFFTEDGEFGSLDWQGYQVDEGTFELMGNDTFAISKEFPEPVTFHYSIHGDTMMLDPVVPDCAPKCFAAAWSVMVSYPGEKWHRAD